jgi:hypothetical protein
MLNFRMLLFAWTLVLVVLTLTARYVCAQSVPATQTTAVIVVRPKSWHWALADWTHYRNDQYQVITVDSVPSPYDLRQSILRAIAKAKNPISAVLLCGDVYGEPNPAAPTVRPEIITPTFELPTSVRLGDFTTHTLATDVLFGDVDNDECPDVAVGRLPAKNANDLARMLKRSIAYEKSQSFGPWRDRIHTVAGVGGFGIVADTAIESVTRRLLSEGIPDRFQLQMTYASLTSPYCPDPSRLTSSFISNLNQGGLFWVYIGHGNVHRLDDFMVNHEAIPICTSGYLPQFQIKDGPPIAVMLACFTGAFDAKVDCFAEQLLAKDDGPIAVIAGSRVTMPYGMSQFSTELMLGCFRDKTETIGDIVLNAKRNIWNQVDLASAKSKPTPQSTAEPASRLDQLRDKQQTLIENMAKALSPPGHNLADERREHVRLMNLLGDPLLRIRQPADLALQCPTEADANQELTISGLSPLAGKLKLELVLTRDRLPEGIHIVNDFHGTDVERDAMQANYQQASNLLLQSVEQTVAPGAFSAKLSIPSDCRGRCVIRAFVYGEEDWATGSQRINIRRVKK